MSIDIIKFLTKLPVRWVPKKHIGKLVSTGSILDATQPGDIVWGTGVHNLMLEKSLRQKLKLDKIINFKGIEICAVRGPITRDFIIKNGGICKEIYGDPGMLASIIHPIERKCTHRIGLIHHMKDATRIFSNYPSILEIKSNTNWKEVANKIATCEVIISSSLHGLIISESYGIPVVFLRPNLEGIFKYADYYLGTDRGLKCSYTLEDAVVHAESAVPVSTNFIKNYQNHLLESFPTNERLLSL